MTEAQIEQPEVQQEEVKTERADDLVEIELTHPVHLTVNGEYKTVPAGKVSVTRELRDTIQQTHQAGALVG